MRLLAPMLSNYTVITIINRLQMQDLLYVLPDTKTQNKIRDKNWERIPLPHAAAQTGG